MPQAFVFYKLVKKIRQLPPSASPSPATPSLLPPLHTYATNLTIRQFHEILCFLLNHLWTVDFVIWNVCGEFCCLERGKKKKAACQFLLSFFPVISFMQLYIHCLWRDRKPPSMDLFWIKWSVPQSKGKALISYLRWREVKGARLPLSEIPAAGILN